MKLRIFLTTLSLIAAQAAFAEVPPSAASGKLISADAKHAVTVNLTQSKVVKNDKGIEELVDAPSVKPNDIIQYRVTYTNISDKPVKGLVADLPIPAGLEYQPNSAKPARDVLVAAEGNQFALEPLARKLPNGKSELVPYTEYRHVRWNLGSLAPGGSVNVFARAKVEAVSIQTPAPASTGAAVKSVAK